MIPRPEHIQSVPAAALLVAMVGLALLVASCGGSGESSSRTSVQEGEPTSSVPNYCGVADIPPKPAPPLALQDSLGHSVNLNQFRGKAVLVTFIYDHCPDVCPIIVGNLHTALSQLGPEAQKLQIIAVSVDPRGDTPRTVRTFLREHRMTGRMEYLIGSRPQLERVWRAWNILAKPTTVRDSPERIEHSETIYGISASGKLTTFYSHDFQPGWIVHDVPMLASE